MTQGEYRCAIGDVMQAGRSAGTRRVPDLTVVDLKEAVPWMIATAEPPR
jgi:hypothetical protein